MCSTLKPLSTNLTFKYDSNITILEGGYNITKSSRLISKGTGSKSFVYKIQCNGSTGLFSVVVKIQNDSKKERLEGLKYEKMVYKLMTKVVDAGVCPFRLRAYQMSEPSNVLVTETYNDMIDLKEFLDTLNKRPDIKNDCYNLLVQLLYAIEVNFRLGIRHNDLHEHNIMIKKCTPETKTLLYLNRNKDKETLISMQNCSFLVKMFDNDRVTKLSPKNKQIKHTYHGSFDSKPVLNLFPWHEPAVYTEKFDLFKIMQHIQDDSKSSYLSGLLSSLHVSFPYHIKKRLSKEHGSTNFMRYHLVTNKTRDRKEPFAESCNFTRKNVACTVGPVTSIPSFPMWLDHLNSSEAALLLLVDKKRNHRIKDFKKTLIGNMTKMYVRPY